MNILVILAEVGLVIALILLINLLVGKLVRKIAQLSWLKQGENSLRKLRRHLQIIFTLFGFGLCIVIIAANSWLWYQGKNLQEYTLSLITNIPNQFWLALATGLVKCLLLVLLVLVTLRYLHSLVNFVAKKVKLLAAVDTNSESLEIFFHFLHRSLSTGIWLLSLIWCAQFLGVPASICAYLYVLLRIYLIIAAGLLIFKAIAVVIDSLDALSNRYSSAGNWLRFYENLRHLIPFGKRCLEYVIYVYMATLVVEQVELVANLAAYGPKLVKIIGAVFASRVLISLTNLSIAEILLKQKNLKEAQKQRRLTIIPIVNSAVKYTIYFGAGIFILETLGLDPTPILAGAGIIGLAVGFGAQNLINDMVSGFFILFENYYLVGDFIHTEEGEGVVEAIELRTTRIRHPNGQLQIIRNGDIGSISNYSKQYVYAVVEMGIEYETNLDQVYSLIELVGQDLQQRNTEVLEPTRVEGINEFGDFDITLLTRTKVKPGQHLHIERILRKMIKDAFDREGIKLNVLEQAFLFKQE